MQRKLSDAHKLSFFFIKEVLGRDITPADYRGRHVKAASTILKMGYGYESVAQALLALRDGDPTAFRFESSRELPRIITIEMLWCWGEPPLIERFMAPPERPPVYSCDYDTWVQRWGKVAIERGEWDGIYRRRDPETVGWLKDVIGDSYEESKRSWQTLQKTSQQNKPSSGT